MSASERASRARACAMVGLSVALVAVCSWITVPIGPVPFTLQMFAIPFILCVLPPTQAVAAVAAYVILGAVGVPLFSGMRGGIGVILGPTGGFLLGYVPGTALAAFFLHMLRNHRALAGTPAVVDPAERGRMTAWQQFRAGLAPCGIHVVAGLIFTAVAYLTGWVQYMLVCGVSPEVAFLAAVAPFVLLDVAKVVAGVLCAQPVKMFVARR